MTRKRIELILSGERKGSMFGVNGPKFEGVSSVQLKCLAAIISSERHQDYREKRWGGVYFR